MPRGRESVEERRPRVKSQSLPSAETSNGGIFKEVVSVSKTLMGTKDRRRSSPRFAQAVGESAHQRTWLTIGCLIAEAIVLVRRTYLISFQNWR